MKDSTKEQIKEISLHFDELVNKTDEYLLFFREHFKNNNGDFVNDIHTEEDIMFVYEHIIKKVIGCYTTLFEIGEFLYFIAYTFIQLGVKLAPDSNWIKEISKKNRNNCLSSLN